MRSDSPKSTERRISACVCSRGGARQLRRPRIGGRCGLGAARALGSRRRRSAAARSLLGERAHRVAPEHVVAAEPPAGSTIQRVAQPQAEPEQRSAAAPPSTAREHARARAPAPRAASSSRARRLARPSASRPRRESSPSARRPCARSRARSRRAARRTRPTRAARGCGAGSCVRARELVERDAAQLALRGEVAADREPLGGGCGAAPPSHRARIAPSRGEGTPSALVQALQVLLRLLRPAALGRARHRGGQVAHRLAGACRAPRRSRRSGSSPRTRPPGPGSAR